MELAVIGSPTFALGFKLAGVRKTYEAVASNELNDAVRAAARDQDVGILVMETHDVQKLDANLRRNLENSVRPTLVAIGIHEDSNLREKLKSALGVDLWK